MRCTDVTEAIQPAASEDVPRATPLPTRRRMRAIRLLDAEPRIAGGLHGGALSAARDVVLAPYLETGPGPWTPDAGGRRPLAILVLDGKLLASVPANGVDDVTVVGPGDMLDVRAMDRGMEWEAVERARLAMIDARFQVAARRWPQLVGGLIDVMFASTHAQRRLTVAMKMPRVEDRIVVLMSLLMTRWGVVRADGLAMSFPVTQGTLGRLVGVGRPTVSLALSKLAREGTLRRLDRRRWWMPPAAIHEQALRADAPMPPAGVAGGGAA